MSFDEEEEEKDETMSYDEEAETSEEEEEEEEVLTFAEHKENGNASYKRKDYRDAIAHYTLSIDSILFALDEEKEHNFEAATLTLTATLAAVYSNRAASHQMLLLYDKALGDCNASIQADSKFLKAHWRKAKVLVTLGRLPEAIKAYSMGMIHDPNDATILKEKEEIHKLQQRYTLAQEQLDHFYNSNANSKNNKSHARQALAQIDIVLAHCPMWADAELMQLQAKVAVGGNQQIDSAYALSTKLLRRQSQGTADISPTLLLARSQCLYYQGSMDDAMAHLKQILAGDPDNTKAFQMVKKIRQVKKSKQAADTAYQSRDFTQAVQLYTDTLELASDNPNLCAKLYFNRGACHNALRNHEECVNDCSSALTIHPEYTKALLRRAASNLNIGGKAECQKAIQDYETAHRLFEGNEQEQDDLEEKIQKAKIQLKRAGRTCLYQLLGIAKDATESEIKKAYRKLALKLHPDRQANASPKEKEAAEAKFRQVNLAHEILSDPQKKRRYDQGVDEQDIDDPHARPGGHSHGHGHGHGGGFGGMDQEMLFEMFMRQQTGGGGRRAGGGFPFG